MTLLKNINPEYRTIVFEGMDGTGKRTQSILLFNELEESGFGYASFPDYESEMGKLVKEYLVNPKAEPRDLSILTNVKLDSLSYIMDRANWAKNNNLNEESKYVFDRYYTSNLLYQTVDLELYDLVEYINWLERVEVDINKLNKPDVVFCLISPPETNMKNIGERGRETDHFENIMFQKKVYGNAVRLAYLLGWILVDVTDSEGNMRTEVEIFKKIKRHLCR